MEESVLPPARTLGEFEGAAARRMTPRVWAYVQGGAGEERTLRANLDAFARARLRPRVWRDVRDVDVGIDLLGQRVAAPFFVCPMAYAAEVDPAGEVAIARAAGRRGVTAAYSTLSSFPIETIVAAAGATPSWFQLYRQPDFERNVDLVRRAERAGCRAILLTADVPVLGVRDRQAHEGFAIDRTVPTGDPAVVPPPREATHEGDVYHLWPTAGDGWAFLDAIREATPLPLLVKGVLTPEDAQRAVEHGAAGVIVSNHGGRQLDGCISALDAVPSVVDGVGAKVPVLMDGGVRRGSDIAVALCLGARAVGIGRPVFWALGAGGEEQLRRYFDMISHEFATVLALLGCRDVSELGPELLG
jgi:4-hydroxymandelate oxidase